MIQLPLYNDSTFNTVINVASVPQRSPFRYPGGKTWLIPRVRKWFSSLSFKPVEFIEPFAGGGIVGLTVAFEQLSEKVIMVELDNQVAAVWKTILEGDGIWLAEKIEQFDVTIENVQSALAIGSTSTRAKAFRTLLKNRVNHGGILAPGSGMLRYGENGKGIKSRWYPATLSKRIRNIVAIKERIRFVEDDGMKIIRENKNNPDTVFFVDPPYTAGGKRAGERLYTHYSIDHEGLFKLAESIQGEFLMSYDNSETVLELAQKHGFDTQVIPMKNTHHTEMTELLISRNLDWIR